jgi:quinoprotein glucose dehydrogenase
MTCHGKYREGGSAQTPLISQDPNLLTKTLIIQTINNGKRRMPSLGSIPESEKQEIAQYLVSANAILTSKINQNSPEPKNNKYIFGGWKKLLDQEGYPGNKPPWGSLTALNLNNGKILYKVPLGEDKILSARGLNNIGTQNLGAPVATSGGLIFVAGTPDEQFRAFDASNGKELWKYKLPHTAVLHPQFMRLIKKNIFFYRQLAAMARLKGSHPTHLLHLHSKRPINTITLI